MQRVFFVLLSVTALSACFSRRSENDRMASPSFATDLGPGESETDGVLVEWRNCAAQNPCMQGDAQGHDYKLHFNDSPSVIAGTIDNVPVRLELDPQSIFRLGDHAIELGYKGDKGSTLEVTWNERDQKLIGHALYVP